MHDLASRTLTHPTEVLREIEKLDCEERLANFVRSAWHVLEPGQPYVHGWHIDAVCQHLEAVTDGEINRLLINIPPGTMKSMLVNIFWPAWEWGPLGRANHRFIGASHEVGLAIRDARRMRMLVTSEWYQERWPRVVLTADQNQKLKFENTETGWREACSAKSITGRRGDRVVIDDPHSVDGAKSEAERKAVVETFLEAVPSRLNNPDSSAIVVIMQRLHEEDVSGAILSRELGYEHLMLPMEFDPSRRCVTSIGFEDPRQTEGDLLFPARFPRHVVERDKKVMGPFATAGQFQQSPMPRGGGILQAQWWGTWDTAAEGGKFPPFSYVVASLDTAYTEKQENDACALTVWGVWSEAGKAARHWRDDVANPLPAAARSSRLMLMRAWQGRYELHDLVTKTVETCRAMGVDRLLIEAKASGISVAQEIRRLHRDEDWGIQLIDPGKLDKVARAYAVQPIFSNGLVFAPKDRMWADEVIDQCAAFPKGKHDDLVDTTTQAISWLRRNGYLVLPGEQERAEEAEARHTGRVAPLYGTT